MKKFILLLFACQLYAQNLPISETNGVVYNQQRFGANLMNGQSIFQKKDGSAIVGTYFNHVYCIKNTEIISIDHYFNFNEILRKYFEIDDLEIFCTNKSIVIVKNGKVFKRFVNTTANEVNWNFELDPTNKSIYYYSDNNLSNSRYFYKYNLQIHKNIFLLDDKNFEYTLTSSNNGTIYFIKVNPFQIYKLKNNKLIQVASYPELEFNNIILTNEKNFDYFNGKTKEIYIYRNGKRINSISTKHYNITNLGIQKGRCISYTSDGVQTIYQYDDFNIKKIAEITQTDRIGNLILNKFSNSIYTTTSTDFAQLFPYIKKYSRLFFNNNSNSVFALHQDNKGIIYAGSYNSGLVTIDNNKVTENKIDLKSFLNGSLTYQDHVLLFGEYNKGVIAFENPNKYWKIADSISCFYSHASKDNTLYLGTAEKGLYYCKNPKLEYGRKLKWKKISIAEGLRLNNILTITEDKFGNIWTGRSSQGISVYNPETQKAITWIVQEEKIDFGSLSSLKDNRNTLWFGTSKGELVFYDGKHKTDYDVKNFKSIKHPLLENGEKISFIHQWKDYIILGAGNKIILFNLKKWYENKTVSVRYLNAYETNFSAPTEQNTILTDIRDETIWFATTDMVYNWDIKKWLTLPMFKVKPTIIIKKNSLQSEFSSKQSIYFKPTESSFYVQINYQTKDNLPRYINGTLVKKGEKPVFESPNLQTIYHFANLSDGDYIFYVRVCQQDGSFDVFEYPICVGSFLWKKWWFILSIILILVGILIYFFVKHNLIEKQKKKITQLNLSSLSNQFRPHFMLNVLNSIGSQMDEMRHGEKIISRLGESINILYGFTQKNEFFHIYKNEWKLVENIIEIQKSLFIPELKVFIENKIIIDDSFKIPIGLIQIPVENALLHGLRNKENGDYNLKINFSEYGNHYEIEIVDNGVGREKAKEINNFRKNGNGLKTLFEMIEILNKYDSNSIHFEIIDVIDPIGTKVLIRIKKEIKYDKIKL